MPRDDRVAVDQHRHVGAIRERADGERAALALVEPPEHHARQVGGVGPVGARRRLGRVAELAQPAARPAGQRLGPQHAADRRHHLPAEREDRVERVGRARRQLVPRLGREERVQPLEALHLRPDANSPAVAPGRAAEARVGRDDILLAHRLAGDRQAELAAGALADDRADVAVGCPVQVVRERLLRPHPAFQARHPSSSPAYEARGR